MNWPQRIVLLIGFIAIAFSFIIAPYDNCGELICTVEYASAHHPPKMDLDEGSGVDEGLEYANWLALLTLICTAMVLLRSPFRIGRAIGLLVLTGILLASEFSGLFPILAYGMTLIVIGISVIALTAAALFDFKRAAALLDEQAKRFDTIEGPDQT